MKRIFFLSGLVAIFLLYPGTAMAFESSPIGWASYNTIANPDPTQTPNLAGTTGGAGGTVVTVTDENSLRKWAGALEPNGSHPTDVNILGPYIIQVQGTIDLTDRVDVMPNRTVIGIGTNPTIAHSNLRVRGAGSHPSYNVIIKNLTIYDSNRGDDKDGITIQDNAHHVWVDHCTITHAKDGALDITHASDYITVSWNYFYNQDKTCLLGHSATNVAEDTGHFKVTYHHNYFGATQRQPRVRFSFLTHVYNNYYIAPADPTNNYGIASTCDAYVLAEGNYFKNMLYPMLSILYSDDPNGWLIERYNIYDNSGTPEVNPPTSMPEPSTYYSYTLDDTNNIPAIVQYGAGANGKDGAPPHWFYGPYGDFDRSGFIDMNDFAQFARYWPVSDCNQLSDADYNGDCKVNFYEFSLFAENWLYIPPTPPAAPTSLWALAGNGTVSLDWSNNSESDLAGYNIYRSTTYGGSYTKLNTSLLSDSNYIDNTVSNSTLYYYVATATDTSSDESGYSSEISAEPNTGNPSIIIQEDNYGFCGVDGVLEIKNSGYTGVKGYVNTDNATGKGINWKINIPSDGTYRLTWRYASLSGGRTARLLINSSEVIPSISFPSTGAWTSWSYYSADVSLTAGIKDIRLEATTSNGLDNIDYLMVRGNNPGAASCN